MDHFAGLDVSVKETSVCIVDETGKIVREMKLASEPDALVAVLKNPSYHFKRIGLEAGPLSQWLFSALAEAGLFLGSHFRFLRLFAAPKRRLVCAIHLARRSRLASGRFAKARTLDDDQTV